MSRSTPSPRRVVFQFLVPVHVEVEDGLVGRVTIIDETPVRDPAAMSSRVVHASAPMKAGTK